MKLGQYRYDANGMRARSLESGVDTRYVYLGHDPLYERMKKGSTKASTDYVYVNGRLAFTLVGTDTYCYVKDALGSTRVVWKDETTKAATTPAVRVLTYKPFGTPGTVLDSRVQKPLRLDRRIVCLEEVQSLQSPRFEGSY